VYFRLLAPTCCLFALAWPLPAQVSAQTDRPDSLRFPEHARWAGDWDLEIVRVDPGSGHVLAKISTPFSLDLWPSAEPPGVIDGRDEPLLVGRLPQAFVRLLTRAHPPGMVEFRMHQDSLLSYTGSNACGDCGAITFEGATVADSVVGLWSESLFAGGSSGHFTLRRPRPTP